MPSVMCWRWLHQAESIGSPANTATAPQHPPHGTQHTRAGSGAMSRSAAGDSVGAHIAWQCPQETQRSPLPHKTPGTEKHLLCVPPCALSAGAGGLK